MGDEWATWAVTSPICAPDRFGHELRGLSSGHAWCRSDPGGADASRADARRALDAEQAPPITDRALGAGIRLAEHRQPPRGHRSVWLRAASRPRRARHAPRRPSREEPTVVAGAARPPSPHNPREGRGARWLDRA